MTTELSLSPLQAAASDSITAWFNTPKAERKPFFYLAGYAGSGKTSIAKYIVGNLRLKGRKINPVYVAFTGKASLVLGRKGCSPSSTIHGLIYKLDNTQNGQPTFTLRESLTTATDLIIADECSMVNDDMANDLLSFDVPILVLGDPGQLPPVDGEGYFTREEPDFFLSEIHRQAEDSAIIRMATHVRLGRRLQGGMYGDVTITGAPPTTETLVGLDQILCGTNRTRTVLNRRIREFLGRKSTHPVPDDKLICLKNNWDVPGMMNGSLWRIIKKAPGDKPNRLELTLQEWDDPEARTVTVQTHLCFFDQSIAPPEGRDWRGLTQFTYGYAITVHKSQGSQWDAVGLYDESSAFREDRHKHLYTGITRAAKTLTVFL